jgi:hypothetical protein
MLYYVLSLFAVHIFRLLQHWANVHTALHTQVLDLSIYIFSLSLSLSKFSTHNHIQIWILSFSLYLRQGNGNRHWELGELPPKLWSSPILHVSNKVHKGSESSLSLSLSLSLRAQLLWFLSQSTAPWFLSCVHSARVNQQPPVHTIHCKPACYDSVVD